MSQAQVPIAGGAIGQAATAPDAPKAPPKRRTLAKADVAIVPEPR
jgi:hypothetical protein